MELYDPMGNLVATSRFPNYASFWQRFGASIIDGLVSGIPLVILRFTLFRHMILLAIIFNIIAKWVYYASLESGPDMATVGKRALSIKVTDMHGSRITFGQASGRYFAKMLSGIILCIGYLMMLWDDKSQTLHDKIANTLVVTE